MTIVENKPSPSLLPVVWLAAVSGLILVLYLLGVQSRDRSAAPPSPLLGMILSIDRTGPQGNFGLAVLGQLFTLVEQIISSDGAGSDYFGTSVSIN